MRKLTRTSLVERGDFIVSPITGEVFKVADWKPEDNHVTLERYTEFQDDMPPELIGQRVSALVTAGYMYTSEEAEVRDE